MPEWRFGENLLEVARPEQIDVEQLQKVMDKFTFACIRGIILPDDVRVAVHTIREKFDHRKDHPPQGHPPEAVRSNFQKLNVGGESSTANNDDARLFRTFYNPIWEEDVWGLRDIFVQLATVRNRIAHLPLDFAINSTEANGLWTAARFHQYPSGGGYFRRHTDYVVKDVADESSTEFYQVVLNMTQKGKDFVEGGAFVDLPEGRICLDDQALPGDILIYDGRTVHGVEDIDPRSSLDLTSMNGRLAGFATLFKKM